MGALSSESLTKMIKFIRDGGFNHGLSWYHDQRRGCSYCVTYKNWDGTIGSKKFGTIDEVNDFRQVLRAADGNDSLLMVRTSYGEDCLC